MQKSKVSPLIYRVFPLYFLDSCFLFLLKIKYVFPLIISTEEKVDGRSLTLFGMPAYMQEKKYFSPLKGEFIPTICGASRTE